jgi:lysophospholipase L1-like esterase
MVKRIFWLVLPCLLAARPAALAAADRFKLVDGDRVVLLGNTLIEREQRYGYWETALTCRYHARNIIFRNLGWSGDTVFGDARAGFGNVDHGFRQLKEHVLALKPTVILIGYGLNESFQGAAGLPQFQRGLDVLLDTLAPAKARLVLLSPLRQEDLGRPLPDPTEQNRNIRLYRDALRQTADRRGCAFVDLHELLGDGSKASPAAPLTDNGIHLSAYGYWRSAAALESGLGLPPSRWHVQIDLKGQTLALGTRVVKDPAAPLRFLVHDFKLPAPPLPPFSPTRVLPQEMTRRLRVRGLAPGKYTLKIDGQVIQTATSAELAVGVTLARRGPEFDQVERLRQAIIAKNRLYFHRWRPQNETYLFGFRKHEQGRNAKEIVQFDPLIARAETEIARLRKPVVHKYELVPEGKAEK